MEKIIRAYLNLCNGCIKTVETKNTLQIFDGNGKKVFDNSRIIPQKLTLINSVKKDADAYRRTGVKSDSEAKDVDFVIFYSERIAKDEFFKGFKIDLTAAYWNAAKKMFLSENTFEMGVNNKKFRLAALGSLATKKKITVYVNFVVVKREIKESPNKHYYFDVCYEVGKVMGSVLDAYQCVFGYYVDCLFLRQDREIFIKERMEIIDFLKEKGWGLHMEEAEFHTHYVGNLLYLYGKTIENDGTERRKRYLVERIENGRTKSRRGSFGA